MKYIILVAFILVMFLSIAAKEHMRFYEFAECGMLLYLIIKSK